MNNPILIIDCHFLCHRAKHSMKNLSYNEQQTGVIFGFIFDILRLSEKLDTNRFIFAWDSSESLRQKLYSGYKNRNGEDTRTDEQVQLDEVSFPQFSILRDKILGKLGFQNIYQQTGYEADDIIASVVMNSKNDDFFVMVSRDNDLCQLLGKNCSMYDPVSKVITTDLTFKQKWGISPKEWAMAKSIAGCSSDSVPGVYGVKEKTAIKFLMGSLPAYYKTYQAITSQRGKYTIDRNIPLVTLPFAGVNNFGWVQEKIFDLNDFMDVCDDFGFRSFMVGKGLKQWKERFCGG